MSSVAERQASFDDVDEIVSPAFPIIVKDQFVGRAQPVAVARAFRLDGGGDAVILTASGVPRTLTGLEDPYFCEIKITAILSATAATKVRLFA